MLHCLYKWISFYYYQSPLTPFMELCWRVQPKTFTLFCKLQSRDSLLILLQNNNLLLFEKLKFGVDLWEALSWTWCFCIIFKYTFISFISRISSLLKWKSWVYMLQFVHHVCSFVCGTNKKCLLFGRHGHDNLGDHYFECGYLKLVLF